jgi:hypothetical protein
LLKAPRPVKASVTAIPGHSLTSPEWRSCRLGQGGDCPAFLAAS